MVANAPSDQYLCAFILIPPVLFSISYLFLRKMQTGIYFMSGEETEIIGIINPFLFQALVLSHDFSQGSYQYWQTRYETPVHNSGG